MASRTQKAKRGRQEAEPELVDEPRSRPFARFFATTAIILVVLYVAALVISRTDGCRAFVAEKWGDQLGLPLAIGKVWADWRLDVHAEQVATTGFGEPGVPGLQLATLFVGWRWADLFTMHRFPVRRVEIVGGDVAFAPNKEGGWLPRPLDAPATWLAEQLHIDLGVVEHVEKPSRVPASPVQKIDTPLKRVAQTTLRIKQAGGVWWGPEGEELARVSGLNLSTTPLRVPTRQMLHVYITGERVHGLHGGDERAIELEFLQSGDDVFLLRFKADRSATSPRETMVAPAPSREDRRDKRSPMANQERGGNADADFKAYVREALEEALDE